ncbi:hypothetical protein COV13_00275 [Candidatus Woesearchaeota archaeon CG10_big_fil_rev_8_21_14_0_10_32_9]|nr:MAG: hypothetical protein COV13_00275 [Candidatus Woesearchaeota archaeon CG10_big_fil_rev_8_21_14_0_10_32_9]
MFKLNAKVLVLFFLVFMLASGASALSIFAQFENEQQAATITNGENINYDVAAIADQSTSWLKVTGKLYKYDNSEVVFVKTLFSETVYTTTYFPSTKNLAQTDYQTDGDYLVDFLAEEYWTDGTTTARSTQIYLKVNATYSNIAPIADFNYTPLNPTTQDTVIFISNSTDDHGIILAEWFVNGVKLGEGNLITKLFGQQGTYSIKLRVTDTDGVQTEITKLVAVSNASIINNAPTMQAIPNQEILESAQTYEYQLQVADQDNDTLVCYKVSGPSWINVESQSCKVVASSIPQVTQNNSYLISVGVSDGQLSDNKSYSLKVVDVPLFVVLDELFCNPDVVVGHQQHCSVHVSENISDAIITFKYVSDDSTLGQCETNDKGYCHINPNITLAAGNYEIYAEAVKPNYISDLTKNLRTTFKVWTERYDVANLKVYEDAFVTENYTFYRSAPMYVSFDVIDLITGEIVPASQGLIDSVFLRVNNNFVLNFTRYNSGNEYKYELSSIPISDDFLGQGNVYAFVFNFTDDTAGQEDVVVNILNNPLAFNPPQQVQLQQGDSVVIDFNQYISDVETPVEDVLLSYANTGNVLTVQPIGNKIYNITATQSFVGNQTVVFAADDTDGSVVFRNVNFLVNPIILTNLPVAVLYMPESVRAGTEVLLNGSESYDLDGDEINLYSWSVVQEGKLIQSWSTTASTTSYLFNANGQFEVTLTVTNVLNESGSTTKKIFIGRNNPQTVVGQEDGIYVENFEVVGTDWGVVSVEDAFVVRATVTNDRSKMKNLRLTFSIPELGFIAKSESFTLSSGDTEDIQFYVQLPFDSSEVPAGEYISLVGVSDSDIIRNKYFPLIIE